MFQDLNKAFNFTEEETKFEPFGSGLINHTWKVYKDGTSYILQRINDSIFRDPSAIAYNINLVADHLDRHHPDYFFVKPVKSIYHSDLFRDESQGWFRVMPFVENSHTIDVVENSQQAYEAARQFGKFTRLLADLDANKLKITLPDFHNLTLRYQQFEHAVEHGNPERVRESTELIMQIKNHFHLVEIFEYIKQNPLFRLRAMHHDTKISNVLFDESDKGLCVIDLDTLMPGYYISDLGDMMRTYLSPVSEEEKDFSRISIRDEFFQAIVKGYMQELKDELSADEKAHFLYAGKFMIYMQAIRFLADHLNDDTYYGAKYDGHNFVRAGNQLTLLNELTRQEDLLKKILDKVNH